jgi:hypothetical protein
VRSLNLGFECAPRHDAFVIRAEVAARAIAAPNDGYAVVPSSQPRFEKVGMKR